MKIITIAAGRGTRVQSENYLPKAMLNVAGKTLLEWSVDSFHDIRAQGIIKSEDLVFVFLKEDLDSFGIGDHVRSTFGESVKIVALDDLTAGPAQTVKLSIDQLISEGYISEQDTIIINDCDHSFRYLSLQRIVEDFKEEQAIVLFETGKDSTDLSWSFVRRNFGKIVEIVEKPSVSEAENLDTNFGLVGVYIFSHVKHFQDLYEEAMANSINGEIFVSHLINCAIRQYPEKSVVVKQIPDFVPLGSHAQISEALNGQLFSSQYKEPTTIFMDLDGTLIVHDSSKILGSGEYEDLRVLSSSSISSVNELFWNGSKIILTTGRHESTRDSLEAELRKLGLKYDKLIMDLGGGPRILVNDSNPSLPGFPTAFSVNTVRNVCAMKQLEQFVQETNETRLLEVYPNESGETTILFESKGEKLVRKISQPTDSSRNLIEYQNSWLRLVREFIPEMVPRIVNSETSSQNTYAFYDMEYIEGLKPLGEYISSSSLTESTQTIDALIIGLQTIYEKFRQPHETDMINFFDVIEQKAIPGIEKGLNLLNLESGLTEFPIKVNEAPVFNILNDARTLLGRDNSVLSDSLEMAKYQPTLIHGDPTLSNIVFGNNNKIFLLDPIGSRIHPNFNYRDEGIGRSNPIYDHSRIRLSLLDEYERWDRDLILTTDNQFSNIHFKKNESASDLYEYFDTKWTLQNSLHHQNIKDLVYFTTLARILPYKARTKKKEAFYILHLLSMEWQKIKANFNS